MEYRINNLQISQEELYQSSEISSDKIEEYEQFILSNKKEKDCFLKQYSEIKLYLFLNIPTILITVFVLKLFNNNSNINFSDIDFSDINAIAQLLFKIFIASGLVLVLLILILIIIGISVWSLAQVINNKEELESIKFTKQKISKYQPFYNLYIQVQNFNTLVDTINAINISEESGGSNKLQDKDQVYSILKILRADLILALNIEKNFRNNPHFSFNGFEINNLETSLFEIQEECNKYGKTLNQAIEISINVCNEMQKIQR